MAASDRVSINEALPLLQVHGLIEWDELGLHLGLSDAAIKEISSMVGEVNLKRRVMISKWLQSDLKATWSKLAKALLMMNPPYKVLAAKIRQQHYPGTEAATSLRDDQETDEEPSAETSEFFQSDTSMTSHQCSCRGTILMYFVYESSNARAYTSHNNKLFFWERVFYSCLE